MRRGLQVSQNLLEPIGYRGELGRRGQPGRRPDGQEAVIADLLERAQILFPIEGARRIAKPSRIDGLDTARAGRVFGVSVQNPGCQFSYGDNGIDTRLEDAGGIDAGGQAW